MFCECILSHLQAADNAACRCRLVDVTDMYRHVHPLWSGSIIQPKIWVKLSDSTCNSTKAHSKKQRDSYGVGSWVFSRFFLSIPSKHHTFNSCFFSETHLPIAQLQKTAHSGKEPRNHSLRDFFVPVSG